MFLNSLKQIIECTLLAEKSNFLHNSLEFLGKFCSILKFEGNNGDEDVDHPVLENIVSLLLEV